MTRRIVGGAGALSATRGIVGGVAGGAFTRGVVGGVAASFCFRIHAPLRKHVAHMILCGFHNRWRVVHALKQQLLVSFGKYCFGLYISYLYLKIRFFISFPFHFFIEFS